MMGYSAFKKAILQSDYLLSDEFENFDNRTMRYAITWAAYSNSLFDDSHKWQPSFRSQYGLYRHTRDIFNPAYRIGEFWRSHLLAGKLDMAEAKNGALPIITPNDKLRPAIAQIWRWSNFQTMKDTMSLWGTVLGDVFIRIVDDTEKQKVYLALVHPSTIKDITLDAFGNVKGYLIEESRPDPANSSRTVTYQEIATREGDNVHYVTTLDGKPYAWDETNGEEWDVPYTFVPMVAIRHNDIGLAFGLSELYPALSKLREVNDLASKLSDQIRKMVAAPMLLAGVKEPQTPLKITSKHDTSKPNPGRDEVPTIYSSDPNAKVNFMVAPLDIGATAKYIRDVLNELREDYPELKLADADANYSESGKAVRYNRAPVEERVLLRRPNYDDAIVRIQQMAVAIGGYRGYGDVFSGFDLGSYKQGELDHEIGDRPVFGNDPMDELEREKMLWDAAISARGAGVGLPEYLARQKVSEDEINNIVSSPEYQARLKAIEAANNLAEAESKMLPARVGKTKNNVPGAIGGR